MDEFGDHCWGVHAHTFPEGSFRYISKSVILIRGVDNNIYLARPYGQLTEEQRVVYDTYAEKNGSAQIIPDLMDIQEIVMDDSTSSNMVSEGIQNGINHLSQKISFTDGDLSGNFEKLRDFFDLNSGRGHEHVSSLIFSFSVVAPSGDMITYYIPEDDSSKPGLLLLYLAGKSADFSLNDGQKEIVRTYFGSDICDGICTSDRSKYTPVAQAILGSDSISLVRSMGEPPRPWNRRRER